MLTDRQKELLRRIREAGEEGARLRGNDVELAMDMLEAENLEYRDELPGWSARFRVAVPQPMPPSDD